MLVPPGSLRFKVGTVSTTNAFAFASQTLPTGGVWFSVKGGLARKEHDLRISGSLAMRSSIDSAQGRNQKMGVLSCFLIIPFFHFQQHIGALNVSTTFDKTYSVCVSGEGNNTH